MKISAALLSLLIIPLGHAATLSGNNGVEILAVDAQKIKQNFFGSEPINLADGKHQIVVKYANNFKNGETVESKPHIFDLDIAGDTEISIKRFPNQYLAEKEIKKGLTWIINNAGKTTKIEKSTILQAEGYFPYRDIEKLIAAYNKKNGIDQPASATEMPLSTTAKTVTATTAASAEQLKQIYQAATKEQRKAFRLWLLEQDMQ